jgi:hypothetical protein
MNEPRYQLEELDTSIEERWKVVDTHTYDLMSYMGIEYDDASDLCSLLNSLDGLEPTKVGPIPDDQPFFLDLFRGLRMPHLTVCGHCKGINKHEASANVKCDEDGVYSVEIGLTNGKPIESGIDR